MQVRRIVADLDCADPARLAEFYRAVFGLETAMDQGWIVTLAGAGAAPLQLSIASEGGSGTPVPALSIEVDDLDEAERRARDWGAEIVYSPVTEPWGVRRFFLRDPDGRLLNVLMHIPKELP